MTVDELTRAGAKLRETGATMRDVDWEAGGRVHNWRRYVTSDIRAAWIDLPDEARGMAYLMAEQLSEREEWD